MHLTMVPCSATKGKCNEASRKRNETLHSVKRLPIPTLRHAVCRNRRSNRLSNKTLVNAVQTALDLCRDAYGNGISGQEERSLRYIALAAEQLKAVIQSLAHRGDARKVIELENLTRSLRTDTHPSYREFPEMDGSIVSASMARWEGRNMPSNVLRAMNIETLPPEMQQALATGQEAGGAVTLQVTQEQLLAMSAGKE